MEEIFPKDELYLSNPHLLYNFRDVENKFMKNGTQILAS